MQGKVYIRGFLKFGTVAKDFFRVNIEAERSRLRLKHLA